MTMWSTSLNWISVVLYARPVIGDITDTHSARKEGRVISLMKDRIMKHLDE